MAEATIMTRGPRELQEIFGHQDRRLRRVREMCDVRVFERDGTIHVIGDDDTVRHVTRILEQFRHLAVRHIPITESDEERIFHASAIAARNEVENGAGEISGEPGGNSGGTENATADPAERAWRRIPQETSQNSGDMGGLCNFNGSNGGGTGDHSGDDTWPEDEPRIDVFSRRLIRARTPGQARYLRAIDWHSITFCTGPAGTGKTWLAVAMAVTYLKEERCRRIVLVRPAVEAGESLGFLPGDFQAKINPYLRPLMDAIREMIDYDTVQRLTQMEVIEMIPLAYMRGRTLNDAFMILDEAQNTTVSQMKMFLTRMGMGSKIVVCGDVTQNDLPRGVTCGLNDALRRLQELRGIASVRLDRADIVRHHLVQEIVRAYDESGSGNTRSESAE